MNEQQRSLGFGYVHFERVVDAERAIKKANRMSINGKEVHVEYFRCKGERIQQNTTKESQPTHSNLPQENRTNLYVNNLDTKINDGMLEGLFLRFGKITSAKIERNQYNVSKQFGFVCFRMPNAATEAIEEMNGSTICDRLIYVGYAQKKSERKEFLSQQFNTSRAGPAKYTPNPDVASERLSNHVSSVKIRSVPSSPTREFSQNFSFERQTKDPLTPYGSSQIPNVEENAINIFEQKTQFRELISPQKSERVENVQDLIPSKDPISPNKLSSGGTSWRKTIPNYDDHGLQQRTAHKVIHEMRKSNSQEKLNGQCVPLKADNGKEIGSNRATGIHISITSSRKSRIEPIKKTQVDQLRSMNPLEQSETLGAIIFPTIHSLYPDHAVQICEIMLQRFGVEEIIQFSQSRESLKSQIKTIKENLRNAPTNIEHFNTDQEIKKIQNKVETEYQTQINSEINQVKQQKRQETKGVNLFVKSLEDEITDELLRTHFVPFGVITSCKVMRDDTNHSKGFGFVCYATPEEATKAVTELNGKIIITKPLYVTIAQRKEERRALLIQQFVNRQMTHISRQNPQHLASGMMQGPPQQPKDMSTKPINITHLTSADPKQQKQILSETLFPIIYRKYPQQAGKITGMLLELEISELLFLLDSGEQLNAKMEEAYEVLQKHQVSVPGVPQ